VTFEVTGRCRVHSKPQLLLLRFYDYPLRTLGCSFLTEGY
jgi:hypothetical protein